MGGRVGQTSRRQFLRATAAGTAIPLTGPSGRAVAGGLTPEAEEETGRVDAPAWGFVLHAVNDPYVGEMQAPKEPPPGTRYVAAEVEIINDADQALNVTPLDVRLRDEAGTEYRGGGAIGSEPMLNPRNLNPGERSRGWVWFILPEEAMPVEIVYVAPPPQFRVPLPA